MAIYLTYIRQWHNFKSISHLKRIFLIVGSLCISLCNSVNSFAEELLLADVKEAGRFILVASSQANILGGHIILGDRDWEIKKQSAHGLIGAKSLGKTEAGTYEYTIFSSSFNDQKANGQPWVAARAYKNCDEPYNSFLAIYSIKGSSKYKVLGKNPYPILADKTSNSDDSIVYCFTSKPPKSN